MKTFLRVLAIIIMSPLWLAWAAILLVIAAFILPVWLIVCMGNFAITGKWGTGGPL
jgi:hypothetical protein